MQTIARLILILAGNLVALLVADYFEEGIVLTTSIEALMPIVIALSIGNAFIRPILKIIFAPMVFITFGIFTILINALILYAIDTYSAAITINGFWPLVLGTHVIGLTNLVINYSAMFVYNQPDLS